MADIPKTIPSATGLLLATTKPRLNQTISDLTLFKEASASAANSSATLAITNVFANQGDWLVVCVSADNAGTDGAPSLSSLASDSSGNTYTLRGGIVNRDPGLAEAGVSLGIFTSAITTPLVNGTVTLQFYPNTVCKAAVVYRVVTTNGESIVFKASGTGVTGLSTYHGITTTDVKVKQVVIGATALEHNTLPSPDTDNINGVWSTQFNATALGGTASTSVALATQYKIATDNGPQSYSTTSIASQDFAVNWILLSVDRNIVTGKGQLVLDTTSPHYYFGRIIKPSSASLLLSSDKVKLGFDYIVRSGVLKLLNKPVRAQIARTPLPDVRIARSYVDTDGICRGYVDTDVICRSYIDSITVFKKHEGY